MHYFLQCILDSSGFEGHIVQLETFCILQSKELISCGVQVIVECNNMEHDGKFFSAEYLCTTVKLLKCNNNQNNFYLSAKLLVFRYQALQEETMEYHNISQSLKNRGLSKRYLEQEGLT